MPALIRREGNAVPIIREEIAAKIIPTCIENAFGIVLKAITYKIDNIVPRAGKVGKNSPPGSYTGKNHKIETVVGNWL